MYEWMTDETVTENLHGDYSEKKIEDALKFIEESECLSEEKHYAIANDEDEYMGTASLRHIDRENGLAEFAVVVRRDAMGKGYAWHGMVETLNKAFDEMGLERLYWRVKSDNKRAMRFFTKHGFNLLDEDVPRDILQRHSNEHDLEWFAVWRGDDFQNEALSRGRVAGCKVIRIKTIPTIEAGELSFFESNNDIDFDIKRIYYISKVPEGMRRGFHAHRNLKQILFCPYGKIQLVLENADVREEITLSDPSVAIVIDKPTWREMLWMQKDSVLVVGASDYYDPADYIRDYDEFKRVVGARR
jgi:RimJ/RimL family protein N-acetyltransferase